MNPQNILEQFLGPNAGNRAADTLQNAKSGLANSGMGGVAGGLAAGGLLGVLLSNKKARKSVGKLAGYGGAAALGALAFRAYQNWQENQQGDGPSGSSSQHGAGQPSSTSEHFPADRISGHTVQRQPTGDAGFPADPGAMDQIPFDPPPSNSKFNPAAAPARDGKPFELALVMAMIGAANADGHIGPDEQRTIFDKVGDLPLDAEDKAFVFDTLGKPPSLQDIAELADGPEQAAELYLASRLAIDPDHPAEQAYLDALASRLSLPSELVKFLEEQAAAATA